jgi:flagellar hook-basal body complex protein FliE
MSLKIPDSLTSSSLAAVAPLQSLGTSSTEAAGSQFKDVLGSAIEEVEGARANATESVNQFLSGQGEDLHSTILASQRADLEFQMFLQVRNKVVSAYQEIMKMQM